MSLREESPALYLSTPHKCSYLEDATATTLLIDPNFPVDEPLSSVLIDQGFRRSGGLFYRPHCEACRSCVSVRVPVADMQLSRNQQRAWRRNQDLTVKVFRTQYRPEHFALYRKYQKNRHPGSSMDDDNREKYIEFLVNSRIDTRMIEMRLERRLLCVTVADVLKNGVSAIYTFFDPDFDQRSLGTFAILWLAQYAKSTGLDWLYLGYWIRECHKMSYKKRFQPLEGFVENEWRPIRGQK